MGDAMTDEIVADYLRRLDAAAAVLPADRRTELVAEIGEHIAAARASGSTTDEAGLRALLDRIGDPEEIVDSARDGEPWPGETHTGPLPTRRPGIGLEIAAFLLMLVGSIVPVVLWLAGIAMLWSSRRLRTGEKVLATLVVPGGPFLIGVLAAFPVGVEGCSSYATVDSSGSSVQGPTTCTGSGVPPWLGIGIAGLWIVAPIVVAAVLLRRIRARADAEPPIPVPVGYAPTGVPRTHAWGGLEVAAVVLLAVGGFVIPLVGPVAGLVCAWISDAWTTNEKWVATAIAAVVLVIPLLAFASLSVF